MVNISRIIYELTVWIVNRFTTQDRRKASHKTRKRNETVSPRTLERFNTVVCKTYLRLKRKQHSITQTDSREQLFTQSKIENTGGLNKRQTEDPHRFRPYSSSDYRVVPSGSLTLSSDKRKSTTQHIPAGMSRIINLRHADVSRPTCDKPVTKRRSSRDDVRWWNPRSSEVAIVLQARNSTEEPGQKVFEIDLRLKIH